MGTTKGIKVDLEVKVQKKDVVIIQYLIQILIKSLGQLL